MLTLYHSEYNGVYIYSIPVYKYVFSSLCHLAVGAMTRGLGGSTENLNTSGVADLLSPGALKRVASGSSLPGLVVGSYGNVYANVWKVLLQLSADPVQSVADKATQLVNNVKLKVSMSG